MVVVENHKPDLLDFYSERQNEQLQNLDRYAFL
jgi:hypothetical protein